MMLLFYQVMVNVIILILILIKPGSNNWMVYSQKHYYDKLIKTFQESRSNEINRQWTGC